MSKYTKFITALVGAIIAGIAVFTGFEVAWEPVQIAAAIMPILTAAAVWLFPNGSG